MTTPTHVATAPAPAPHAPPRPARRASPIALSWLAAALLGLALLLGNAALSRANVRADLTEDRLFTLTDATRRVAGSLSDDLRVRVYWGEEMPSNALPVRRRLEGLLDEYVAASGGRISVTWVKMDEEGKREAGEKGIPEGDFQVLQGNTMSLARAFHGLVLLYEDKMEVVGPLAEMSEDATQYQISSNLEYELTSAIYKISRTKRPVVGVVSDAPPMNFMNPHGGGDRFSVLGQILEKVYGNDLRRSLSLEDPVPAEVTTLLVLAPRDWSEKRAFHLEQFLLRGGKVLLLHDTVDLRVAWGGQPQGRSGLEDWLKHVGVEVLPGVVSEYDPEAMCGAVTQQNRLVGYPYWPRLRREHLDQSVPATRDQDGVPLYWASELAVDEAKQKAEGRALTVLATTSAQGGRSASTSDLQEVAPPTGQALAKRTVLLALDGNFVSFWKGKPVPGEAPPTPPGPAVPGEGEPSGERPPAPAAGEAPAPPAMEEPPAMGDLPGMEEVPAREGEGAKPPPPVEGPKGPEGAPGDPGAPAAPAAPPAPARLEEGRGFLVVLSDADVVADDFSGVRRRDMTGGATAYFNGVNGFRMVPNLLDWLSGSDELLELRSRGVVSRKLDEIPPETATQVKVWNYLVAPVLVLLLGLLVYFVRRYRS